MNGCLGRECFQPAFRIHKKGGRDNDPLTWLNPSKNLDLFAKAPSRFDLARLEAATELAIGDCRPDLTVLIDTPLDVANERRTPDVRDRFESADLDFHQRVREGYLAIAAKWGDLWCVIDGSRSEAEVADMVDQRLASLPW